MIFVMVKVPNNLSGASLLGVHDWVKSNITLANPGGSPDYKLTDPGGNPLSLSDVARSAGQDVIIEVTTVSGVRRNPVGNLTMIPGMDSQYPDMIRTGNSLTDLLPGEIDSAMATRIVAEQGLHRGLHTLNRMSLTTYNKSISSPTTAALLQMGEIIKSNPSDRTPFTQRTPIHYGSETALASYMKDISGASEIMPEDYTNAKDAKIAARYGFNTADVEKFAQDVLSDYLFAASANRGLIRTLVRNMPELRKKTPINRETIQKLSYMFPTQPQSFYEGSQRVFVAHTAFIYPAYAEAILSKKQMTQIVKFAKDYPRNMGRTDTVPRALDKMVKVAKKGMLYNLYRRFLTARPFRGVSDSSDELDANYESVGHMQHISDALSADPRADLSKSTRPLRYFSDLGGFYPAPPPKWPRKLMYAIMDAMLENLPHIINMDDPSGSANLTPVQVAYFKDPLDPKAKLTVSKIGSGVKNESLENLELLKTEIEATIAAALLPEAKKLHERLKTKGFTGQKTAPLMPDVLAQLTNISKNIDAAIDKAVPDHNKSQEISRKTLTFDPAGPKSMLELTYDVAEIATVKYDYNMRGDDFKFVMGVIHYSLTSLAEGTHGSTFALTSDRVKTQLNNILGTNRYSRLQKLEDSVGENDMGDGPRRQFMQTVFLAKLLVIRDDMETAINADGNKDARVKAKIKAKAGYIRLVDSVSAHTLSPELNAGVQKIFLEMNQLITGA